VDKQYLDSEAEKLLERAQADFDAAADGFRRANVAARQMGLRYTPEMTAALARLTTAEERLKQARQNLPIKQPSISLTDIVLKKVRKSFPEKERVEAIRLLENECGSNLLRSNSDTLEGLERIRLAVVKLAQDRLPELRRQIEVAKRDWRDVINWAESPHEFGMDVVTFGKLDENTRRELRARDREQYLAWLEDREISGC
jgi:hypothetical protein